jgi:hypothetical protein
MILNGKLTIVKTEYFEILEKKHNELLEALEFARALLGAMPVEQIERAHKRSGIKLTTSKSPRDYLSETISKARG